MRMFDTRNGLTVRAIVGTHNVLFGMDLAEDKRAGCLGFTLRRTDLTRGGQPLPPARQQTTVVPNRITFPGADPNLALTTDNSPVQKFRWGDYTVEPGERYRFQITARYGTPEALTDGPSVTLEFATEDPQKPATAVFFNRGAAASQAFVDHFGADDPDKMPAEKRGEALAWLSRGLQEALIAFLQRAQDGTFALHAAVYEFQKPKLLAELKAAAARGAEVAVVYHFRHKDAKDNTWKENEAAAKAAGIAALCTQRTQDAGVIMHNKFVVLLQKGGEGKLAAKSVWTGSTNWTDGGIYGQLNVGHAIDDPALATTYEAYFQLLKKDEPDAAMKPAVAQATPVPTDIPAKGAMAIFSPQSRVAALDLYGAICARARCLLACAPFELAAPITRTFDPVPPGTLHYLLLDKEGSLGKPPQIAVIERDLANSVAFAATLTSNLTGFQNKLNARSGESFHHPGIHIHSKILLADPFGDDPILVTGSANYSINSTQHNDENSLVIRGDTAIADIYATEFMRMFEHYHFRAAKQKAEAKASVVQLDPTDGWSAKYYAPSSPAAFDRMTFAGTLPMGAAAPGPPSNQAPAAAAGGRLPASTQEGQLKTKAPAKAAAKKPKAKPPTKARKAGKKVAVTRRPKKTARKKPFKGRAKGKTTAVKKRAKKRKPAHKATVKTPAKKGLP